MATTSYFMKAEQGKKTLYLLKEMDSNGNVGEECGCAFIIPHNFLRNEQWLITSSSVLDRDCIRFRAERYHKPSGKEVKTLTILKEEFRKSSDRKEIAFVQLAEKQKSKYQIGFGYSENPAERFKYRPAHVVVFDGKAITNLKWKPDESGTLVLSSEKRFDLRKARGAPIAITNIGGYADRVIGMVEYDENKKELYSVLFTKDTFGDLPVILVSPCSVTTNVSNTVTLICKVEGKPKPTVTWLKDDVKVNIKDSRISPTHPGNIGISEAKLTIRDVSRSDMGLYKCVAHNGIRKGVTSSAARLTVNSEHELEEHTTAIISSTNTTDSNGREEENQENDQVPAEIKARGTKALEAYRKALKYGEVEVHRGRIMLVGQARAGKTSLKKSLLGLPFNPAEQSTVGVEVDPSCCCVDVDNVKNWQRTDSTNIVSNSDDYMARMIADELKKDEQHEGARQVEKRDDNSENEDGAIPQVQQQVKEESYDSIKDDGRHMKNEGVHQPETPIDKPGETPVTSEPQNISEDVTEKLVQYLQSTLNLDDSSTKPETIISIWDFAGQHLYYASHAVFLSPRAVYLLVYDLSKDLNAEAELCVRQGTFEKRLKNADGHTNIEAILSWLVSIHNIRPENDVPVDLTRQRVDRTRQRPRVIMVGTNADHPFQDPKKMEPVINIQSSSDESDEEIQEIQRLQGIIKELETVIKKSLSKKNYKRHVVKQYFAVDNTKKSPIKGIQSLQDKIKEVFLKEPYMGEKIPVRWLNFEKVIQTLVTEKETKYLPIEELAKIIRKVCYIDERDEISAMLDFYHDLGVIVKHGDTVVLQTQWLIDLFKKVITIQPYDDQNSEFEECWNALEKSGILSMKLVEHVFSELLVSDRIKEDLLRMMGDYGLIAAHKVSDTGEVRYFVPAQLQLATPKDVLDTQPSPTGPCALCMHFVDGFVPHGLYTLLVSKCIAWCSKDSPQSPEPNLYRNASRYFVGTSFEYQLVLICYQHYIKVILISSKANKSCFYEPVAVSIRNFIESTLQRIPEECRCYRSLKYQLSILCPSCSQKPCKEHEVVACCNHDCVHLLKLEKMTFDVTEFPHHKMVCKRSFDEEAWPEVQGLQYWYPPEEQKTVPSLEKTSSQPKAEHELEEHTTAIISSTNTTDSNDREEENQQNDQATPGNIYKMESSPRGLLVIINIEKFWCPNLLKDRVGSDRDVDNLVNLFTRYFDFKVEILSDKSKKELYKRLYEICDNGDNAKYDCFACCIMSHGKDESFFSADGYKIKFQNVISIFTNERCWAFKGRPKIFIIQACRDEGSGDNSNDGSAAQRLDNPDMYDILKVYACYKGFSSFRAKKGTIFIQSLVKVFRDHANKEHIADLFTKVIKEVHRILPEQGGDTQVPVIENTLQKKFYLRLPHHNS